MKPQLKSVKNSLTSISKKSPQVNKKSNISNLISIASNNNSEVISEQQLSRKSEFSPKSNLR